MKNQYQTDFSCVHKEYTDEQRKYHLQTGSFVHLEPKFLSGSSGKLLELDLSVTRLAELQTPTAPNHCTMNVTRDGVLGGFVGYFDTSFRGSTANPVNLEVVLPTAPTTGSATHWGQQVFCFNPPFSANRGDTLECTMWINRQKINHRLLQMDAKFTLYGASGKGNTRTVKAERQEMYFLD